MRGHPLNAHAELLGRLRAAWLEGSDADGRADRFSHVDLWLDVAPGHEEAVLERVREVVASFGPLTVDDEPVQPDPQVRQRFRGSAGLPPLHTNCVQSVRASFSTRRNRKSRSGWRRRDLYGSEK
ncbi:hypothetical protein ACFOPQ_12190 [Deinococcus antarcticus]|uniref:Uncharacterized protein n=1 Tax=Deinococcus antarcticus TaxID=1298767 RepID=A0ABV8ABI5_9DEIO